MPKLKQKNPSSQIFWNDLENDKCLKTCSLAAKGLWTVHILAIAARSIEPGVVQIGTHPCRVDEDLPVLLARVAGAPPEVIAELLAELINSTAAGVDDRGRIFNRRMVRKEAIRQARADAGLKGANVTNAGKGGGKAAGKQVGSPGGKPDGKADNKQVGKTVAGEGAGSAHKQRVMLAPSERGGRQNAGSADGKSSPSSLLLSSSDSVSPSGDTGDQESPEPADVLFKAGLQWLVTASAHDEATCRTRIGSWLKALGGDEAALLELMREAQRARPKVRQPLTWIQAAINRQPKKRWGRMAAEAQFVAELERRESDGPRTVHR